MRAGTSTKAKQFKETLCTIPVEQDGSIPQTALNTLHGKDTDTGIYAPNSSYNNKPLIIELTLSRISMIPVEEF